MDWYKQAAQTDCPNSMGHHGSMCWFHVWSSLPCWGLLIHESPSWLQLRQRQQELRGLLVSWLQESWDTSMFLFSSETCALSSYYSTRQGSACLPPYHFIGLGKSMQNIPTRTSISITVKISQDIVWLLSSLPQHRSCIRWFGMSWPRWRSPCWYTFVYFCLLGVPNSLFPWQWLLSLSLPLLAWPDFTRLRSPNHDTVLTTREIDHVFEVL